LILSILPKEVGGSIRLVFSQGPWDRHGVGGMEHSLRTIEMMSAPSVPQPKLQLQQSASYRENYANSVQLRVSLWDFFLMFGLVNQNTPEAVTIENFQGVYLSPPQAKALFNVLQQNLKQYEAAFGEIRLEAHGHGEVIQ
jgi:hypothetical protein